MKLFIFPSLIAALLVTGCGKSDSTKTVAATNAEPKYDTGNPLTAPADYIGAVGQAEKYSVKQIDLAYVNQAIQQFQAGEGRLPKDLNEMVAMHYLGKIPDTPYGSKIVYDATSGTVKVVKQ